jgi:sulfate adenylyltransferase subunit 1
VDYSQDVYDKIIADYKSFASRLDNIIDIRPIPISALNGDNIVNRSENMPWYEGASLLYHLENVYVGGDENHVQARFPVQWVIRPQSDKFHDFRGFAGRVSGGVFKPGDAVRIMPSGFSTTIDKIYQDEKELAEAFAPQSVVMTLNDEIDISRGDMIVKDNNAPRLGQDIEAMICWFSTVNLNPRSKFVIRHTTREAKAIVSELRYKMDINTLRKNEEVSSLTLNEIGRVKLHTASPLFYDSYDKNRHTGSFILIDPGTNETVAAGMIL